MLDFVEGAEMTVLFSPIGTADPITQLGDGPMLHLVRHYNPRLVVLFLSPKMSEYDDADNRYERAIEKLCAWRSSDRPEIKKIHSQRVDVHHFDGYIQEFEKEIRRLVSKYPDERVVVNASSGTPAMEQALVAIGAFGWYPFELAQVATPRHDTNTKEDRENPKDYELEIMWGLDPDNEPGAPDRVESVSLPHFKDRLLCKNIEELVADYDYAAALKLCAQLSSPKGEVRTYVEQAYAMLNLQAPVKEGQQKPIDQYLWMLEVRLRQGDWAGFVRAFTPAFTWTLKLVLSDSGLPEEGYIKTGTSEIDREKVKADERLSAVLMRHAPKPWKHWYVSNRSLSQLVGMFCADERTVDFINRLDKFETGARNIVAHEVVRIEKSEIEHAGGITLQEVMGALFELNHVKPGKFDELNSLIVEWVRK